MIPSIISVFIAIGSILADMILLHQGHDIETHVYTEPHQPYISGVSRFNLVTIASQCGHNCIINKELRNKEHL